MAEYMTLLGAEDVRVASKQMRSAAEDMNRAASAIEYALTQFTIQMSELVRRLEALAEKRPPEGE